MASKKVKAQTQFIRYVRANYPSLYSAAVAQNARIIGGTRGVVTRGLRGLGATVEEMLAAQDAFAEPKTAQWYESILGSLTDTIKNLAPAYVGVQQAKTCIDINAQRAKAGLSPLNCDAAGLMPQAQVNVGISKEIQMLAFVALGIGALYMFTRKGR